MYRTGILILRNLSSMNLIEVAISDGCSKIIAATDDISVHSKLLADSRVEIVTFIDQMIPIFEVSEDTLRLREVLNKWLRNNLPSSIPDYFFTFIKHAEGGNSTQKIVDALIIIKSFQKIIKKYSITDIYIKRSNISRFDDDIIIATAYRNNINVHEFKDLKFQVGTFLNLTPSRLDSVKLEGSIFLPQKIKVIFKAVRTILRILVAKVEKDRTEFLSKQNLVLFIAEGNAEKAVNPFIALMNEFNRLDNYYSILLFWRGSKNKRRIKELGLQARNLESYYNIRQLFPNILWLLKIWKSIKISVHNFEMNYEGILLGSPFRQIILNFILEDVFQRKIIFEAAECFLKRNKPIIFHSRGDFRLDLDILFYNSLKKNKMINLGEPLFFSIQSGLNYGENFGKPEIDALDLSFVIGEWEKKLLSKLLKNTEIKIGSWINVSDIYSKNRNTKEKAMQKLNITKFANYNFCFISSNIVSGVYSYLESAMQIQFLVSYVFNKDINLIIKPHPSEDLELINQILIHNSSPDNVFCLSKNSDILDCLDASDVIIQKISTVGLEAIYFQKPVIAFALDGEKRFLDFWEEGCEIFMDTNSFRIHFNNLLETDQKFRDWSKNRLRIQNEFIKRRFFNSSIPPEKFIVQEIIKKICSIQNQNTITI